MSQMTDEEIVNQLIQVKGIGRWTAEMFLIFCLGRQDILPVGDLGVRKAIQKSIWIARASYGFYNAGYLAMEALQKHCYVVSVEITL